jgi:uncharacterized protein YqgV (UPF0045/DUF77 family)
VSTTVPVSVLLKRITTLEAENTKLMDVVKAASKLLETVETERNLRGLGPYQYAENVKQALAKLEAVDE